MRRAVSRPVSLSCGSMQGHGASRGDTLAVPARHPVTRGSHFSEPESGNPPFEALDGSNRSAAGLARGLGLERRALPPPGRLRSLAEVAAYLGVCIRTVRRLITRGELRVHRVGRNLRIQDAELAAFVAASLER